jgi:hypothetical protein
MPIYGFDETKSKFPVLDKATYDPANKSGQIAVINDIKPVVLTNDATVNPLIPTLYVMNAASKTITLGTNVNVGIEVTVFAKIATTVSYIVNGVTVTEKIPIDNTVGYIFNGSNWVRKRKIGQIHNATLIAPFTADRIRWCVTNGICTVEVWGINNPYSDNVQRPCVSGLPLPKLGASVFVGSSEIFYMFEGNTDLICQCQAQNANKQFFNFNYPVVDDWVES